MMGQPPTWLIFAVAGALVLVGTAPFALLALALWRRFVEPRMVRRMLE